MFITAHDKSIGNLFLETFCLSHPPYPYCVLTRFANLWFITFLEVNEFQIHESEKVNLDECA